MAWRWEEAQTNTKRCYFTLSSYTYFLLPALNKFLITVRTDDIVENTRCLLSVLRGYILLPWNCIGCWSCEGLPSHGLEGRKTSVSVSTIHRWRMKPRPWILSFSPQNSAHWCCLLYLSSPWWLCSSGCLLHLGAPAVSLTPAPDRSLHRSQPGSFQLSPVQETNRWSHTSNATAVKTKFQTWDVLHRLYGGSKWGLWCLQGVMS